MPIIILFILLTGCTTVEQSQPRIDPYTIECREGENWLISEHGETNLNDLCIVENEG